MRKLLLFLAVWLPLASMLAGCATSPTGRKQLAFLSQKQLARMGQESHRRMAEKEPVAEDPAVNRYVRCIVDSIATSLPASAARDQWQVTVYDKDDAVNAFALPGGYIGVYTGLLQVAETPSQLAAVIGHEIAHVTADHANSRVSTHYATQAGLQLVNAFLKGQAGGASSQIMAVLGLGAQVGVTLPFSRSQEKEADILGLEYMARAGFDPRQSVDLWRNMAKAGGGKPPEFLSTHPAEHTRIETLQSRMPGAMELFREARQKGRKPACREPGQ
jgi:predicted Zn-dependent protease